MKAVPAPVLVVDDDDGIRSGVAELLSDEGFVVVQAQHGAAALDLLRSGLRPSLILLDLMMPRMDGWGFRFEQTRDPALRDIATVVVTASGFELETLSRQLGGVEVFRKPFDADDLVAMVRRRLKAPG